MLSLEKQCTTCKQVLSVEEFWKDKGKRDGLCCQCKKCAKKVQKLWCQNGGYEMKKAYAKANPILTQTGKMLCEARSRAKTKNLPFNIDANYLREMVGENAQFASHCPIFNVPLEWSARRGNSPRPLPNSPSLDRIDPTKGYVKGNVWIISYRANAIKNNATHEELKLVTKAVGEAIVNSLEF